MVTSDYEVEHGGSDVAESHFVAESVSAVSALPHGDHRLRHTQHVLGQLRVFLWSSPSELDATIRCSDGDVQANKVVLAAVSKFLRQHFNETADALVVVPGLTKASVNLFFHYLFHVGSTDSFRCADAPVLATVAREFAVDELDMSGIGNDNTDDLSIRLPINDQPVDLLEQAVRVTLAHDQSEQQQLGKSLMAEGTDGEDEDVDDLEDDAQSDNENKLTLDNMACLLSDCDMSSEDGLSPTSVRKPHRAQKPTKRKHARLKSPKRRQCLFCQKSYAVIRNRNLHMVKRHRTECHKRGLLIECDHCKEAFVSSNGFRRHLENIHKIKAPPPSPRVLTPKDITAATLKAKCLTCPLRFPDCQALRAHVHQQHPEKSLHCLMCDSAHPTKLALFNHIQEHQPHEDNVGSRAASFFYRCDDCGMNFSVRYEMRQHVRRVHRPAPSFVCGECEMSFYNARNLGQHVLREHGPGRNRRQCPYCERAFRYESHLERHLRKHTGVKHCVCDRCGKALADNYRLREHQMVQHPEMNSAFSSAFRCDVCDFRFPSQAHLTRHFVTETHKQKVTIKKVNDIFREYDQVLKRKRREMGDLICAEDAGGGGDIIEEIQVDDDLHQQFGDCPSRRHRLA